MLRKPNARVKYLADRASCLTKILLPKSLIFSYCLIAEVIHYKSLFYRIEIEQVVFKLCSVLFK